MSNAVADRPGPADAIESVLIQGDLSKLTPAQRTEYYLRTCQSLGLNHLTRPFDYLNLSGKLILYARKDCTEQLRANRHVAISIAAREVTEGCYVVTARAVMPTGRTDESIGAVLIDGLKGEARANAMMKAETKAKRRVTLSICGLGLMDETEVETVPGAQFPAPVVHTHTNGRPQQATPAIQDKAPDREPGSDDGTPDEPTWPVKAEPNFTGTLPQVTQRAVLDALHEIKFKLADGTRVEGSWHDERCRARINEIIGRELHPAAHVSTLTTDEADKVLRVLAEARAAKAKKREAVPA